MTRINITLREDDYENLMKCYKNFIERYEGSKPPISLTGYTAALVLITIDRILREEKL